MYYKDTRQAARPLFMKLDDNSRLTIKEAFTNSCLCYKNQRPQRNYPRYGGSTRD